jgi:CRP-like cAMP-binding protein
MRHGHPAPRNVPFAERRRRLQNRLLRALPADDYNRIARHLKPLRLERGQVLHAAGTPLDHVYFPVRGACGVDAVMETGQSVEVATIGCEGLTAIYTLMAQQAPVQVVAHIGPAEAQRIPVDRFEREMDRHGALRELVADFYRAFVSETLQSVACNRLHSTRQRYCRRLLTIADRIGSDAVTLTHDVMATMLGIQRPAVTLIASSLKHTGLIAYTRGVVVILDRVAVEASACECYRSARARIAHLLPPPS